jgi:hypothetical protein
MIELEHEFIYRLGVRGPLEPADGSPPDGRREFWQMTSATLHGPRVRAATAMPGIDWFSPYEDGFGRPHVRLPFHTDDGALLLLEYHGIVQASAAFAAAVDNDTGTEWSDQYMRMALTFDTTSPRYTWMAQHLFIARGRLLGATTLEYDVHRVL